MVYAYIRFSTSHQEETQQMHVITEFVNQRGITIDTIEKDEGVSGGVSYRNRNLNKLVKKLRLGDTLVVTEISRLGRTMSDISKLLNEELKPRKVRLIIIKMGIDVDCSALQAQDDFLFSALSFAAQLEKEMIQQRTQSAIDAIKDDIAKNGGHVSKSGRYITKLGNGGGFDTTGASVAAGVAHTRRASDWRDDSALYAKVTNWILKGIPRKEILAKAIELYEENPAKFGTRKGKPLCEGTLSRWVKEIRLS